MDVKHYEAEEPFTIGEDSGVELERPMAQHANNVVKHPGNQTAYVDLGPELGEVRADKLRFRAAQKAGHLLVYVREQAQEHPNVTKAAKITSTAVALGVVAGGVLHLKHRKK